MKNITILLLLSLSYSATLLVPDEYSNIQSAINASSNGDEIIVSSGTYYEHLEITGKTISIIGSGREYTIIHGNNNGRAFAITSFSNADISSLSITNGLGQPGGGVYIYESTATIHDVDIKENTGHGSGAGLSATSSDLNMYNVKVYDNDCTMYHVMVVECL